MNNEIINLKKGATTESLKLNETDLWFSSEPHKSIEKMQSKVEKNNGKFLNNHGIVAYDRIIKIQLNEKSEKISLSYPNAKGKEQLIILDFEDTNKAHRIGEFIASKTTLKKKISTESKNMALLKGLLWPVGIVAGTLFIALVDTSYESEGHTRSSRRVNSIMSIIKLLRENIGQIGIIIIGLLITCYLLFKVWKRFSNPVNDITYQ